MRLLRFIRSALLLCAAVPIALRAQPPGPTPSDTADTTAWNRYFADWEAAAPTDARLWIDRFNHLFGRSRQPLLVLRGADGADGADGATGPQGPKGDTGLRPRAGRFDGPAGRHGLRADRL